MKIIKEAIRILFVNNRNLFIFLCGVFLINILPLPFFGIRTGSAEPVFSITSDNEPLYEVLAKISKSTGYKIEITKGWQDKSLTASLKKMTLEKGIREIMRIIGETSYAVVLNDSMKKVEIRIFDVSSPGQKRGGGAYVGTSSDFHKREKAVFDRELIDPEVEMRRNSAERERTDMEMEMERKHKPPPEVEIIDPD